MFEWSVYAPARSAGRERDEAQNRRPRRDSRALYGTRPDRVRDTVRQRSRSPAAARAASRGAGRSPRAESFLFLHCFTLEYTTGSAERYTFSTRQ